MTAATDAKVDQALAGLREALIEAHRRGYPVRPIADAIVERSVEMLPDAAVRSACCGALYGYVGLIESGALA